MKAERVSHFWSFVLLSRLVFLLKKINFISTSNPNSTTMPRQSIIFTFILILILACRDEQALDSQLPGDGVDGSKNKAAQFSSVQQQVLSLKN